MKLTNEILTALLLTALLILAAGCGWWGYREAPLVHAALWNFSSSSYDVKQNSGRELVETNKVLVLAKDLLGHTDCSLNGCPGIGQRKPVPGLVPQMTSLVKKAQPVADNLANVTASLDVAVKDVDGAIQHLDALLQSGTATIAELQAAIKQTNATIADLDRQATDPDIKAILANFVEASKEAAASLEQFAAIATDGRQVADKA